MARSASCPIRSSACSFSPRWPPSLLHATRFGAHLYAVGGNAEGARLAGVRTDLVTIGAHVDLQPLGRGHRPLSREPSALRRAVGRARRRLRSRIDRRRGDRRNAARGRTRRRLGDAGRRLAVRHARRRVQHARRLRLPAARPARRDRHRRRRRLHGPHREATSHDDGRCSESRPKSRAVAAVRRHQCRGRRLPRPLPRRRPSAAELSRTGGHDEFPAPRGAARHSRVRPALRSDQRRLRSLGRLAGHARR